MAGTYRVIVPTVVRKAAKMDSDVADPPRLEAGAEIEVTDCVKVRAGKRAKVQRLHFAGGWCSWVDSFVCCAGDMFGAEEGGGDLSDSDTGCKQNTHTLACLCMCFCVACAWFARARAWFEERGVNV